MRIVIAPDKFKGSLSARAVAEHLASGLRSALPEADVITAPMADGGEGTSTPPWLPASAWCRARCRGRWAIRSVPASPSATAPVWVGPGCGRR